MRRGAQAQDVEAGGATGGSLAGASCSSSLRTPATAVLRSLLLNLSYLLQVGTLTAWSLRAWLTPGLEPCGRPLGKGAGLGCCKGCCLPGGCGTWGAITPRIWLCEDCRSGCVKTAEHADNPPCNCPGKKPGCPQSVDLTDQ